MKKSILAIATIMVLSVLSSGVSYAGHRHHDHGWNGDAGWAAAGGLFGGMLLGAALADSSRPAYYYPQPVYYQQPAYYQPAPAYVQPVPYVQPVYYTPAPAYPTYGTTTTTTYTTYPSPYDAQY